MSQIKSLADQLRHTISLEAGDTSSKNNVSPPPQVSPPAKPPPVIIQEIINYDASKNKAMVHVKLDPDTAKMLGHFKMATGVDNIKLVAFAVRHLFQTQPELKTYIKNFILNFDL